jgi:putative FmdB family regulatory protein
MPKYVYECKECGITKEIVHSMQEKLKDCVECDTIDTLRRIPSFNLMIGTSGLSNPGDKVKEFIEDAKEEVSRERKELKKRDYKND